jgi:hypothetical protein
MQKQLVIGNLFIAPQMLDAGAEQIARAPNDPVDRVPFLQEQLGQIRTVLPGNAGDERNLLVFTHGLKCGSGLSAATQPSSMRDA